LKNVKAIPVISHYEGANWDSMWYNCAVYPYGYYTDDMLSRHMMYQQAGVNRNVLQNYINYIPEEFLAYE
jgi:poly-gamma-glutamate synthesis protein (capsule biosynthesis protein)